MRLGNLIEGELIKRYKRFLADVRLADGREVTAHCPNTGSMKRCAEPGSRVWLLDSDNAKRKYPLTWELVEVDKRYLACINTGRANALVQEAVEQGVISELQGYSGLRREVKYADNSRIDLLLSDPQRANAWVEVKNVTLLEENNWGCFPDAVTARGAKHLQALMQMVQAGDRAVLMFCVAHTGIELVRPADHIDPEYGRLLREASKAGVEILAYQMQVVGDELSLKRKLPVQL